MTTETQQASSDRFMRVVNVGNEPISEAFACSECGTQLPTSAFWDVHEAWHQSLASSDSSNAEPPAPLFRFKMIATHRPDDPYYVTNWDRKREITVVAATNQKAINLADTALGNAGSHHHWVFRTLTVIDHRIPEGAAQ